MPALLPTIRWCQADEIYRPRLTDGVEAANGLKGVLVDAYGAYANWKTGALLKHTKDSHDGVEDAAA
jgi:hypothetical protein